MGRKSSRRRQTKSKQPAPAEEEEEAEWSDDVSEISTDTVAILAAQFGSSATIQDSAEVALGEVIDALSERRAQVRVDALEKLAAILKVCHTESLARWKETCLDTTLGLLRRAGEREAVLACRVLSVLYVHLGEDNERVVKRCRVPLLKLVTRGASAPVRCAGLRTLCACAFLCSEDHSSLRAAMRTCMEVLTGQLQGDAPTKDLRIKALESWAFLATADRSCAKGVRNYHFHLQIFAAMLAEAHPSVRAAAGEALAILDEHWEAYGGFDAAAASLQEVALENRRAEEDRWITDPMEFVYMNERQLAEFEEEQRLMDIAQAEALARAKAAREARRKAFEEGAAPAAAAAPPPAEAAAAAAAAKSSLPAPSEAASAASSERSAGASEPSSAAEQEAEGGGAGESVRANELMEECRELREETVERLRELSTQSSKAMSRRARRVERRAFREILATLEDGEAPAEEMTFPNGDAYFSGWQQVLQLAMLRRVLGSGLQAQLGNSEQLMELFDIDPDIVRSQEPGERMDSLDKRLLVSKSSEYAKQRTAERKKERQARDNQRNYFMEIDQV